MVIATPAATASRAPEIGEVFPEFIFVFRQVAVERRESRRGHGTCKCGSLHRVQELECGQKQLVFERPDLGFDR